MNDTLYVSDLDRTLLNSDKELSQETVDIINELISEGMKFTIATARSWYSAHKKVRGLSLELPVSTYNGSYITDPTTGEVLESKTFDKNMGKKILDSFLTKDIYPLVFSFIEDRERVSYLSTKKNPGINNYLRYRKDDERLREVNSEDRLYDGEPFYFSAIDRKDKLEGLIPKFEENQHLSYNLQEDLNTDDHYCLEIKHREADKALSVKRIKEITSCSKIVSFGDHINDIPMFSVSDECYAVSNGNKQLKETATGIIPSSDEDGVARWLKDNVIP